MTADDLLKCGPTGISGHNCIYLKNIYKHFCFEITSWYVETFAKGKECICWCGTNCTCLNIVTQSMFVERAHSYILKDIMAGIYWLVELRPGASAEIISVCNWIFHITSRFSHKDDRLQILHFQCYDCWWTGVTCGLIQLVKKKICTILNLFLCIYFASLYSSLTFETLTIYVLWRLFYITEEYNLVQSKHENIHSQISGCWWPGVMAMDLEHPQAQYFLAKTMCAFALMYIYHLK